jgi:uncharacterized protein YkwD
MPSIDTSRAAAMPCPRAWWRPLGAAMLTLASAARVVAGEPGLTRPDAAAVPSNPWPAHDGAASASFERRVHDALNRLRAQRGLEPLEPEPALVGIARRHSEHMARAGRLSHAGFGQRFDEAGGLLCVENVAKGGRDLPERLVAAWLQSGSHARNLVEPRVRLAGIARSGAYTTWLACDTVDRGARLR